MKPISVEEALHRWADVDRPESPIALRSVIAIDNDAISRTELVADSDGPLSGVPILVKDNIEAEGLPCTAGSLALQGIPISGDSTVAARLRRAGAVIIGAANLSEWANIRSTRSSSGWSAVGGLVANPWALDRSAGGSSSGSGSAVAAGIVPMAVGTETDGSITCPAALNGVVGIKPTVGLVPTDGVVPISSSQDSPGALARTVDEATMMLAVLSDDVGLDGRSRAVDIASIRVGVVDAWRTGHAETDALFDHAVALAGRLFSRVAKAAVAVTPDDVGVDEYTVLTHELRSDLDAYLARRCAASGPRSLADVIEFNRNNARQEMAHFGQEIFEMAAACDGRVSPAYADARARNLEWVGMQLDQAFAEHDILIAPAYMPAWKTDLVLGHPHAGGAVTSPAAIAGLPILTLPMGLVAGLPVAVSLVGTQRSEDVLIAVARVIERELGLSRDPEWGPRFISPARG